ncbi:molybdate ABC transporter substrate-binding protein [Rhizobium sp. L1K21]|nr:molybdate ABC transporter substrate-binding protein [Rhizobium sp. L1K21]
MGVVRFLKILIPAILLVSTNPLSALAGELRIFAAASMKNALDTIAEDWHAKTGDNVVLTFASSSAIAKQIEQGAPADIFISADLGWMDYLEKAGEIKEGTRINLAGNALVLIAQTGDARALKVDAGLDLAAALDGGRLSVGATESVPAGRYAKAALVSLGLWDSVKDHLAEAENVRAALALVSRGEAPLGIVYSTDAKVDAGVKVLSEFPQTSYPPIIYPAAVVKSSTAEDAGAFISYMQGAEAQKRFAEAGFTAAPEKTSN